MDNILSAVEASKKLNISSQTVKRWIKDGKLKGYQSEENGKWYADSDDSTFTQHLIDNCTPDVEYLKAEIERLHGVIERRDCQNESMSQQIDHLTQVVAMSQKNIGALTEQLDDSRQMIEDMRQRRTVWQRFKAVFVAESA